MTRKAATIFTPTFSNFQRDEFNGVGPRIGFDTRIDFDNGFGFVARAAGSFTIGDREYEFTDVRSNANLFFVPNFQNATNFLKKTDEHVIVPEFDYRVGFAYDYEWNPGTGIGVEIGWQAMQYFELLDRSDQRFVAAGASYSDWGIQGPYIRFEAAIA